MSYENELSVALEAASEAGAILRRHLEEGTKTWEKSEDNPVTLADLEADKAIAARLSEAFPGDADPVPIPNSIQSGLTLTIDLNSCRSAHNPDRRPIPPGRCRHRILPTVALGPVAKGLAIGRGSSG